MIKLITDQPFIKTTIVKSTLDLLKNKDKRKFVVLASINVELMSKHQEFLDSVPVKSEDIPIYEYKRYYFQRNFLDLLSLIHEAITFINKSGLFDNKLIIASEVKNLFENIRNSIGFHYSYHSINENIFAAAFDVYSIYKTTPFTQYHAKNMSFSLFTDITEIKWRIIYLLMRNQNWKAEINTPNGIEKFKKQLQKIELNPETFDDWFDETISKVDGAALDILNFCTIEMADLPLVYNKE